MNIKIALLLSLFSTLFPSCSSTSQNKSVAIKSKATETFRINEGYKRHVLTRDQAAHLKKRLASSNLPNSALSARDKSIILSKLTSVSKNNPFIDINRDFNNNLISKKQWEYRTKKTNQALANQSHIARQKTNYSRGRDYSREFAMASQQSDRNAAINNAAVIGAASRGFSNIGNTSYSQPKPTSYGIYNNNGIQTGTLSPIKYSGIGGVGVGSSNGISYARGY